MRKGLCLGRALSARMAVLHQDATRAMAAVVAAGSCWQQRRSGVSTASFSSSSSSLSISFARGHAAANPVLVPKSSFSVFIRDLSDSSFAFRASSLSESVNRTCVENVEPTGAAQCGDDANKENIPDVANVSSSPEDGDEDKSKLQHRLDCAAAMFPHPSKAAKGGEDAFFIEGTWLGIADGVGGWASDGIDAGLYSRELMLHCKELVSERSGKPDPKDVLVKAASRTKAVGSATALVAAFFEHTLYAANIGDSGFMVVRDWAVLEKSRSMQHAFNFPYQIGTEGNDPSLAMTYEVCLRKGDIVLLATDGLFDNLYDRDILMSLKATIGEGKGVQEAATHLAEQGQIIGKSGNAHTPFSASSGFHQGGKLDDVTVLVGLVN